MKTKLERAESAMLLRQKNDEMLTYIVKNNLWSQLPYGLKGRIQRLKRIVKVFDDSWNVR